MVSWNKLTVSVLCGALLVGAYFSSVWVYDSSGFFIIDRMFEDILSWVTYLTYGNVPVATTAVAWKGKYLQEKNFGTL